MQIKDLKYTWEIPPPQKKIIILHSEEIHESTDLLQAYEVINSYPAQIVATYQMLLPFVGFRRWTISNPNFHQQICPAVMGISALGRFVTCFCKGF